MARHSSGSRSGGSSHSSSHRSGSRSGGSRSSSTPFAGSYNRSYYDRHGRFHSYYTTNKFFGVPGKSSALPLILTLVFVTLHMVLMLGGFVLASFEISTKIDGPKERIYIEDNINVVTSEEEERLISLFEEVYEKSGMPVALLVDDYRVARHYDSIEIYAEQEMYSVARDEESMLIVFLVDFSDPDFIDWHYDFCCGDNTIKCLPDGMYYDLTETFYRAMSGGSLPVAIEESFNRVMDRFDSIRVGDSMVFVVIPFLAFIYGIFYVAIFKNIRKAKDAERYFRDNPHKLEEAPVRIYAVCPACGGSNSRAEEKCPYCGSLLIQSEDNVTYVR